MDVNFLSGEELKYELQIRGLPLTGSFAQKRAELREILRLEREKGIQPPLSTIFGVESELCLCRAKVFALERDVRNITDETRTHELKRINTILVHVVHRLNRVNTRLSEDQVTKSEVLLRCENIFKTVERWEHGVFSASLLSTPTHGRQQQSMDKPGPSFREVAVSNDLIVLDEVDSPAETGIRDQSGAPVQEPITDLSGQPLELQNQRRILTVPSAVFGGWSGISTIEGTSAMMAPHHQGPPPATRPAHSSTNLMCHDHIATSSAVRRNVSEVASGASDRPIGPSHDQLTVDSLYREVLERLRRTNLQEREPEFFDSEEYEHAPMTGRRLDTTYTLGGLAEEPTPSGGTSTRGDRQRSHGADFDYRTSESRHTSSKSPPARSTGNLLGSGRDERAERPAQVRFTEPERQLPRPTGNSTFHEESSVPLAELARQILENSSVSPVNRFCPAQSTYDMYSGRSDVHRWNVKYDGQSSVNDFLERIEEMRRSRGVSKSQLLRSAADLLTGDALLWLRTRTFTEWDDLVWSLKESFQPYDYEYGLWDEIRRRTQGAQERVLTFVVAMENLFRKLPSVPSDDTKINIVRRNLLPYIQSRLATHRVTSMPELLSLARTIEETETRIQRFTPPPTNYRTLLEPSLAYQKPRTQLSAVRAAPQDLLTPPSLSEVPDEELCAVETSAKQQPLCWNCGEMGHRFRKCQKPKQTFCFKCGRANVVTTNCSNCSKNLRQGRST